MSRPQIAADVSDSAAVWRIQQNNNNITAKHFETDKMIIIKLLLERKEVHSGVEGRGVSGLSEDFVVRSQREIAPSELKCMSRFIATLIGAFIVNNPIYLSDEIDPVQ